MRPLQPHQRTASFSLVELMMVIAIIGLINGITIAFTSKEWQRERVNAVAVGLAGWLEEVRSNATPLVNQDSAQGGCEVTIATLPSAVAGNTLATVSPASCASSPTFVIPGVINAADRYNIAMTNGPTVTFTPRGSVTSSVDAVVKIFLVGSPQMRCVRISGILGVVRVGSNSNASSSADSCNDYIHY